MLEHPERLSRATKAPCREKASRRLLLGISVAALSLLGGAADAQSVREIIADLSLPEVLEARGTNGSISINYMGCTAPAADTVKTGSITLATVVINTRTLKGTATVQSTLGTIQGELTVNSNDIATGTWQSTDLDNMGVTVSANGTFATATDGGADISDDLSTVTYRNVTFDTANGTGSPCGSVQVDISGTLVIDTSGASSTELTQSQILSNFINSLSAIIPSRTSSRLRKAETADAGVTPLAGGMMVQGSSAGDGFGYPWGVWASYQKADFENDLAVAAFDANADIAFVGTDFVPWDNVVAGVAFGYERTRTSTIFNGGKQDQEGFSVVPYLGALISDQLGVDFDLGFDLAFAYTSIELDQFRTLAGNTISSQTDSDRWVVMTNLNAGNAFGDLYVSGQVGLQYASEEQDEFTEFNSNGSVNRVVPGRGVELGRASIGGDVAYAWGGFEPYAGAQYQVDFTTFDFRQANDIDEVLVNAGLRYYGDALTASFDWNSVLGRENFESNAYTFTMRADF